ncbi:hypothetical protein [Paenibacillus sabinae]|uniref:Uncharacterized protein n=1 Tax=Paenibacillus sabinae T27 TaxID=1268072 RepID=X4Z781_9BACL|nr:hypothetical protein [Paenibacillus sabinae]AHV95606.1 hypothetical protein PSAB_03350 [Paenibacillus sabinae T27]
MKLIITKHAFERYCERAATCQDDFYHFQNQLRKVPRKDLCFLEWKGKPAVYFDQTYWRYVRNERTNTIILITCLGILEYISIHKWANYVTAKNSRAAKKLKKSIRRKEMQHESTCVV